MGPTPENDPENANKIYEMCEDLAVHKIGCPPPDEKLKEIPEITDSFKRVFDNVETEGP